MSWENEQDRIVRGGRLYSAPPEMVFAELKELSRRNQSENLRRWENTPWITWAERVQQPAHVVFGGNCLETEALETLLVERTDPLINLGLACYGTNKHVFTALYQHSLDPARDLGDGLYKRNLRMGCLSNQTITKANPMFDFPRQVIGEREVYRILSEADLLELEAMVSNPTVSDKLLEEIFSMTGAMPQLSDERQRAAVRFAARNERIEGPDMGPHSISKAIFRLLEIAPVEPRWFWVVYDVLGRLDPQQVHTPERIDHVLERWGGLKLQVEKYVYQELLGGYEEAQEMGGIFTHLPMTQELRCHIAALYGGRGLADGTSVYFGSPTAEDIALRCAYYACGYLTEREMKAGYKRDKDVYLFGASFNSRIMELRELRQLFEEKQFGGSNLYLKKLYLKHFAAVKKKYPYIGELSAELKAEARSEDSNTGRLERIDSAATALQSKVAEWSRQLQTLKNYAIFYAVVLAVACWFKK